MCTKQQAQQAEEHEILGAADIYSVVSRLWERAAPGMPEKELEWFKECAGTVVILLNNFADTVGNIGISVGSDKNSEGFSGSPDVSKMLYFFSDYLRCLNAMVYLGKLADEQLRDG